MDLDELAQVESDAPWMHAIIHGNSLAQADVAEYFWNSCAFKKAMGEECDGDSLAQISP